MWQKAGKNFVFASGIVWSDRFFLPPFCRCDSPFVCSDNQWKILRICELPNGNTEFSISTGGKEYGSFPVGLPAVVAFDFSDSGNHCECVVDGIGEKQKADFTLRTIKTAYLLPMAIPAASVVLLWKLMFDRQGFVNGVCHMLGLQGVDWMNTQAAFVVLVFSYIWKNLGYTMVLWLAGLSSVSPAIYEAAKVDGAGSWTRFFKITLPLIRPMIFTIVILSFLNSFKVFREAYLVAGNYPQEDMYLLQHLFNNWFLDLSVDKMAAGSVLMMLVIGTAVILLQKMWEK